SDERGEDGNAADVILGGVDRIDDPSPRGVAARAELFADDGILGPLAVEAVADRSLHRLVDVRNRRAIVFRPHGECAAEGAESDSIADVRQLECELQIGMHALTFPSVARRTFMFAAIAAAALLSAFHEL